MQTLVSLDAQPTFYQYGGPPRPEAGPSDETFNSSRSPAHAIQGAFDMTLRTPGALLALVVTSAALTGGLAVAAPAHAVPAAPPSVEPQLVAQIDTSAGGTGARLLLGDLTGDGRLDVVTMQPTFSADDRFIGRQVQALTAYDLSGELLWQIGTPDPRVTNNGTDIPAIIYDLDGDGDNEVIAVMEDEVRIFDGRTGTFVRSFGLPHPEAHDTIFIANVRGTPHAQDIVLKTRYEQLWALDEQGTVLWTFRGTPGHHPYPHDFTGDGRQELIGGYDFLTPDGVRLWTADMADHPDSISVGDVDGNGVEDIAFGGAGLGGDSTNVYRPDGTVLYRNLDAVEAQQVGFGDFRPDLPGLELAGLDRVDRTPTNAQDSLYLLSSTGEVLWKEQRTTRGCFGTVMEPLHNWDGTYGDLMLGWNRGCGEIAGIWDGFGNRIATFPVDSRFVRGDVCGDDRTEAVGYVMGVAVYVFATGPCDLDAKVTGRPRPQAKMHYNYTRYTAEEIPADLTRVGCAVVSRDGRIDLGRRFELTGVMVEGDRSARARLIVEVSDDGRHWTRVADRRRSHGERTDRVDFTALARYVRVHGPDPHAHVAVLGTR